MIFAAASQPITSSEDDGTSNPSSGSRYTPAGGRAYQKKNIRGTVNIMTPDVVAALDACRVSYRRAVKLVAAIAAALGIDIQTLILNKSSYNLHRRKLRVKMAAKIKENFANRDLNAAILHWDGSIIPDSISCKKTDRIPIVISDGDYEKMLAVPGLPDGKGLTQAEAIYSTLTDWGVLDSIKAFCCDTTAANLGRIKGAAVILEQMLERDILFLPCRHHMRELNVAAVFEIKLPGTSGPNVPLFKRFQNEWQDMDQMQYQAVEFENLHINLRSRINPICEMINRFLSEIQPRDDYKELLELSLIFLGHVPPRGIRFYKPGAYHHARWMAKVIYSLKIYIFRKCFKLAKKEEKGIFDVCIFTVFLYLKEWYECPLAASSPKNDLDFIKALIHFREVDPDSAAIVLNKLSLHLWYLAPETAAMAFFDRSVPLEIKSNMVKALNSNFGNEIEIPKHYMLSKNESMETLATCELDHFIDSRSVEFFKRFGIDEEFLKQDISSWPEDPSYIAAEKIVKGLSVINDVAERYVKLAQDYIDGPVKAEDDAQYLLQIVAEYRQRIPDSNKRTLVKKLKNDDEGM